jgi:hypothetical protein
LASYRSLVVVSEPEIPHTSVFLVRKQDGLPRRIVGELHLDAQLIGKNMLKLESSSKFAHKKLEGKFFFLT